MSGDRFETTPVDKDLDPGCARCGSSTGWIDCWACADGLVYDDDSDAQLAAIDFHNQQTRI